jgi:hypothetical protein
MEKLGSVAILGVKGDAKAIHSKGTLPTDWRNRLNLYAVIQGGNTAMRHVCGNGDKFKLIAFTVKLRYPKGMYVVEELYTVSKASSARTTHIIW